MAMQRRVLPVFLLLMGAAGCGAPEPSNSTPAGAAPVDWSGGGKADELRADFFSPDRFYFVRIDGWDPARMTPASLRDETSVAGAEVRVYRSDPNSDRHCPDAEVGEDDLVYRTEDFTLQTSGNFTNGTPKSSYKVEPTTKEARLYGMKALNLKSMWNDVSQMREAIAWRLFRRAGVAASRHVYAKLCIDDRYYGLYSLIEEVDKSLLKVHFGKNDDGNLYKAYWADIGPADLAHRTGSDGDDSGKQYFVAGDVGERTYRLKTNEDPDDDPAHQTYDDLAAFVRVVNGVDLPGGDEKFDSPEYRQAVEQIFDVRAFLRWAAVNVLLGAWDNYYRTPANYYLYNSGKRGGGDAFMQTPFFHWLPWDYDNSLGSNFFDTEWQYTSIVDFSELPLVHNLLANGAFRAYYLDALEHLLDNEYSEERIVDVQIGDEGSGALWDKVRKPAYLESDTPTGAPHTGRQFTNDQVYWNGFRHYELDNGNQQLLGILHFVRMRHDSARAELDVLRETIPKGSSGAEFPETPVIPSL